MLRAHLAARLCDATVASKVLRYLNRMTKDNHAGRVPPIIRVVSWPKMLLASQVLLQTVMCAGNQQ